MAFASGEYWLWDGGVRKIWGASLLGRFAFRYLCSYYRLFWYCY